MKRLLLLLTLLAGLGLPSFDTSAAEPPQPTVEQRIASLEAYVNNTDPTAPLKAADGKTAPVDADVTATAYNLNGQLKDLSMRRNTAGGSTDFIGETDISGNEILVFNIQAAPRGQSEKYQVQFKREFFAD